MSSAHTLWAYSADDNLTIFFLFFQENRILYFLFSGKNKKNISIFCVLKNVKCKCAKTFYLMYLCLHISKMFISVYIFVKCHQDQIKSMSSVLDMVQL